MPLNKSHQWQVSPKEAIAIQEKLRQEVQQIRLQKTVNYIGGADISFDKGSNVIYAGIVVLDAVTLKEVARSLVITKVDFPYIPGLLSFREVPALLDVWEKLTLKPDILMLDGQGLAHPRRFGLACHFGVLVDVPTIGCAKTLFVGKYDPDDLAAAKGSTVELVHKGETVGVALRTRARVNPVFISVGHKITLAEAIEWSVASADKYRIPQPTRQAHIMVNELRLGNISI